MWKDVKIRDRLKNIAYCDEKNAYHDKKLTDFIYQFLNTPTEYTSSDDIEIRAWMRLVFVYDVRHTIFRNDLEKLLPTAIRHFTLNDRKHLFEVTR